MAKTQTDEAYPERNYVHEKDMSHIVTSRELVRQVPIQSGEDAAYPLGDFVPLIPLKQ